MKMPNEVYPHHDYTSLTKGKQSVFYVALL